MMRLIDNTILITGGGSGIGRAMAEELHQRGNQVIIAGRRGDLLAAIAAEHPGMAWAVLDITDPASIALAVARVLREFSACNMLVNCAGVQALDDAAGPIDDATLVGLLSTNLIGPIRLTSALVEHFKRQDRAAIIHVTSMLGFLLPLASTSIYSATKAAMHSFAQSQRYRLRGSSVAVIEIAPPYVQTALLDGADDPRAMPLVDFIAETMALLEAGEEEILVSRALARRDRLRGDERAAVTAFNDMMALA